MDRILRFAIDEPAIGKARHRTGRRNGRTVHFADPKTKSFEQVVALVARRALGGGAPFSGAVRLEIECTFVPPRSWSKKRREEALAGKLHTAKPDADNVAKAIKDALNGIAYLDDKQVADLRAIKRWGPADGFVVTVLEAGVAKVRPRGGPTRIRVTHEIGHRRRPSVRDMATAHLHSHLLRLLLEHLQVAACGAAQREWASYPQSRAFMEAETGRKGWRAYLDPETARLVDALEADGIATFIEEPQA